MSVNDSDTDPVSEDERETAQLVGRDSSCCTSTKSTNKPPDHSTHTCFLYALTFLSAIGGFLFGYDTGVVSGAMILIVDVFDLNSLWTELIVSVTVGFAAIFSVIGGISNAYLGRRPTILFASVVFLVGSVVLGVANSKEVLLVGRSIVGIGIGLSSMTVPMYISECAPTAVRGQLIVLNNVFITGGQLVASVLDGAFSTDSENGWRYMLGIAGLPALFQTVGFMFMPESPRWLVNKGYPDKAAGVLRQIRNTEDINDELTDIQNSIQQDTDSNVEQSFKESFLRIFNSSHIRRALLVGCGLQMFQQISGINTVMYYSATIIQMSGIQGKSLIIWLAAVTASINFLFTFVGLYFVERIGRRKLTLISLIGTMVALVVLGVGFQLAASDSPPVVGSHTNNTDCTKYKWCDGCISTNECGYCYEPSNSELNGTCDSAYHDPLSGHLEGGDGASSGPCSPNTTHTTNSSIWVYEYCPTKYSWMTMFGLVLYLVAFAPGMGPMPWTVNSEIYPLWCRSECIAISTMTNWVFNLLVSMTFLTLLETLTKYGAFYLYSSFAFLGVLFVYFLLPETQGKTLEEIEKLFMSSRPAGIHV